MHWDVADVGWGGTLMKDTGAGAPGFWAGQGFLDRARATAVDHNTRTTRSAFYALPIVCRIGVRPLCALCARPRGQPSSGCDSQLRGELVEAHDVRAALSVANVTLLGRAIGLQMDTVRSKPVRRRSLSYLGSGRRSRLTSATAQYTSAISLRRTGFLPSTDERGIPGTPQTNSGTDEQLVGRWLCSSLESTFGLPSASRAEEREGEGSRSVGSVVLACPRMVRALGKIDISDSDTHPPRRTTQPSSRQRGMSSMIRGLRRSSVRDEITAGIRSVVLGRAGYPTNTGGAEEAACILSELTWAESTWSTRAPQVALWLRFCDEDMRDAFPADEGDVLAYICFLSIERRVSPESLPQYVSAVSRYHELHHLPSPTKTPLVRALVQAYRRDWDSTAATQDIRIGVSGEEARRAVAHGMTSEQAYDVVCCAATVFAFVFQCRLVSLHHLQWSDVVLTETIINASLFRHKGKSVRRPLRLAYPANSAWGSSNPIALFQRWARMRYPGDRFFNIATSPTADIATLHTCVTRSDRYRGHRDSRRVLLLLTQPPDWWL